MKFKIYTLLFVLSTLAIGCKNEGPEEVLLKYFSYISTGKCEQAMDLCTDEAKDFVQGLIDLGCTPYESVVHSINCTVEGDAAVCDCDETSQYGRFLLSYNLVRIDGIWKVHIEAQTTQEF